MEERGPASAHGESGTAAGTLALRPECYRADLTIDRLRQRNAKLLAKVKLLEQRIADLTLQLKHKPKPAVPAFVKANVIVKATRKKPGRRVGHEAALRPMPEVIDVHQDVPVPIDTAGKPSCPRCRVQLLGVKRHKRYVEDIVPAEIITTCYHTISGYCPCCDKVVESRAADQPPAADLPHAQLGLNTLATAAGERKGGHFTSHFSS